VSESAGTVLEFRGWEIDLSRRELRLQGIPVPLGSRAFEIIEVLVRAGGELVNKYDLMQAVWPGAVVEENTLHFQISAIRKALGSDRSLLKTVSGRGYRLIGNWVRRAASDAVPQEGGFAREALDHAFQTNLPLPSSTLIGRSAALEHLRETLALYRVVTLTGPGGIGKSVLAIETGRGCFPTFRGDCWLVELASLTDANLVPSALARVLRLRVGGDEISFEAVARAIGRQKLLIILDNCEHLVDAAAKLAQAIVSSCPNVSVLATSREALRIAGEYEYHVPPLDVPPDTSEDLANFHEYSAVQLFLARMSASNLSLATDQQNVPLVAAVCRRLDGIPLAIEFAASRSTALGLEEVAARLDDRFRLLTGGRRTALARHQTLRATLDWSYELLTESERCILRRLAIFVAGFALDAALYIMRDTGLNTLEVVEGIANLVAKSLVAGDGSSSPQRWRLLETIRAYAFQQATESGEAKLVARRHAEFFQQAFSGTEVGTQLKPGILDVQSYSREIDDVRAALDWSFSPEGDERIGITLAAAYTPVWLHLGWMAECRDRTRRALDGLRPASLRDKRLQMKLYIGLGTALVFMMGSVEQTKAATNSALTIAESLDDWEAQLRALWALWLLQFNIGECYAARDTADQFGAVARRTGDTASILVGDRLMGASLQYQGQQHAARPCFERVLQLYIAPDDKHDSVWFHYDQRSLARTMLARVLWLQGSVDQAVEQAARSVTEAGAAVRGLSLLYPLAWATYPIMLMTGNLGAAEEAVCTLKEIATQYNATWWKHLANCLEAKLQIKRGEFSTGVAWLRSALRVSEQTGWTVCYPEFLGAFAEGLAGLGQFPEAIATIDRALQKAHTGGECWYLPELLRIKAELLGQSHVGEDISNAEHCLKQGLDIARNQGALFWELRCAFGLAQQKQIQNLPGAAQAILAPVFDRFTEGFETEDLRTARMMLDQISRRSVGLRQELP
jgi:predicted ATPase/DNA-binding winged helix-turn-helix (wHTH) protein